MDLTRTYLEFFKFGEREITQILSQQEKAKNWDKFQGYTAVEPLRMEAYLEAEKIVKHLKILVKDFESDVSAKDVCKEIQKILGEKNIA